MKISKKYEYSMPLEFVEGYEQLVKFRNNLNQYFYFNRDEVDEVLVKKDEIDLDSKEIVKE